MKKIILGLALIASLSSVASAYKITVSQQPIVQPHYEGCVLVYQFPSKKTSASISGR
ncbi:hypothetical protein ACYQEL_001926 [Campylobacter jejuni]